MEHFSFISALIGSFITAVFSYSAWLIQKYVVMRSERKRVAFFYLVKICEISAIKRTIESVFKNEIVELKNKAGDNKYIWHLFCVGLSEALNNNLTSIKDNDKLIFKSLGDIIKQTNINKENCFGCKIDNEIVSKFPQSAILNYHFFINYLQQLQSCITIWTTSLEKLDFKIYTPEYLYGQIECVKNIFESTESLINSLAQESGIKKKEVNHIIAKQVKEYSIRAIQYKFNKQITDLFLESYNKAKSTPKQHDMAEKTLK